MNKLLVGFIVDEFKFSWYSPNNDSHQEISIDGHKLLEDTYQNEFEANTFCSMFQDDTFQYYIFAAIKKQYSRVGLSYDASGFPIDRGINEQEDTLQVTIVRTVWDKPEIYKGHLISTKAYVFYLLDEAEKGNAEYLGEERWQVDGIITRCLKEFTEHAKLANVA